MRFLKNRKYVHRRFFYRGVGHKSISAVIPPNQFATHALSIDKSRWRIAAVILSKKCFDETQMGTTEFGAKLP